MKNIDHYLNRILEYAEKNYQRMFREPDGYLKYQFLVPGSCYDNCLWDWDSWLTNIALRQFVTRDISDYEKGCIINYLEYQDDEGRIPIMILPDRMLPDFSAPCTENIHKPCLAQHASFLTSIYGNADWLRPYFDNLLAFVLYYYRKCRHKTGLYFWNDDIAIGVDNDPSTFYRPHKSSASIFLNCMMYMELKSVCYLGKLLGRDVSFFSQEAENLKHTVRRYCYDEKDGFYYSVDLNLCPVDKTQFFHAGAPRNWDCLIQRIGCWSGFLAMWSGIATSEQAERMVKENLLNESSFWAPYGVRSLSKYEKMYQVKATNNPSCWLGPVWGISNYLVFCGLLRYEYEAEAAELAQKTIKLLGQDIERCGEMHEYYDPESGEPVMNPGFQNWNLLAVNMGAWLSGTSFVSGMDLCKFEKNKVRGYHMKITELKFNGISQPLGYDMTSCTLTWNVEEAAGTHTAGYSVRVSENPDFRDILWEESGTSVPTGGVNLRFARSPRTRYYVAVSVTDETGDSAAVRSWFETGKIDEEWKARWITCAEQDIYPVFGRLFQMKRPVAQARLYLSAAGVFEAYLNGKKIGDEYLTPYLTDYRERMQVITFPVEEYLQEENRLEIMTGKGWYMGRFGMPAAENTYGDRMAVIAELHVTYDNGEEEVIGTDSDWTYRGSDIEESGIYDGERINRMLWKEKDNSDRPVMLLCDAKGSEPAGMNRLTDRLSLPIREKERIVVKEIFCTPAGETVLDMGQNFAGVMEFQADFPEGTKISLEFGEILQNGNFYNENYRSAANPFVYVSDGRKETVRPHFTYSGFRYVRVSGWPGEIRPDDFAGIVMYSDMERTGMIHTSDEKINRLYENTVWGMKSNFWDMPTDCPQRDERLGWTGDAQVFAPAACYHMDTRAFYRKFIEDLKTEQKFLGGGIPNYLPNPDHAINVGSIWGDIATILPDTLYHFYGDREMLSCTYPMMRDWIEFIDRQDEERGQRYLYDFGFTFGDWLALDGTTAGSFKGNTDDAYLSSLYYCHSIELTKNAAGILGYEEDRKRFEELHEKVKHAIFQEYFTSSGRLAIDTQAAYVAALRFGIYPDKKKLTDAFRLRLKKDGYQIRCGFVGAPLLCSVLAENGMEDLAWDLLLNEDFPGWLYCVNLGATTIWERWNSVLPDGTMNPAGMNSLNHFSYGSVAEFLYAHVCGIQALEPGFRKVRIAPLPDVRVSEVSCDYRSVSGMYHVSYQVEKDGMIKMRVKVPFDCRAEIRLPGRNGEKIEVSAGEYEYHYRPDTDYRHPYHKATTLKRLSKDPNAMAILGRYVPAYAGIAASGDLEMGANTLVEMSFNDFIPVDREQLSRAMEELEQLEV